MKQLESGVKLYMEDCFCDYCVKEKASWKREAAILQAEIDRQILWQYTLQTEGVEAANKIKPTLDRAIFDALEVQ